VSSDFVAGLVTGVLVAVNAALWGFIISTLAKGKP
jgi:hypothetical protein